MGELAVTAVDRPPLLSDGQDGVDLPIEDAVHRVATRSAVHQRGDPTSPSVPAVDPVVADPPTARTPSRERTRRRRRRRRS